MLFGGPDYPLNPQGDDRGVGRREGRRVQAVQAVLPHCLPGAQEVRKARVVLKHWC